MATRSEVIQIAEPQIKSMEGFRTRAYPDPLSGGAPYTIGWGQTGPNIGPDTVWTEEEAQADFDVRLNALCDGIDQRWPWWMGIDAVRAAVLPNMGWQLGLNGLAGFPHMLGYLQAQDFVNAAAQMRNSVWHQQTPARSEALARQMETGEIAT